MEAQVKASSDNSFRPPAHASALQVTIDVGRRSVITERLLDKDMLSEIDGVLKVRYMLLGRRSHHNSITDFYDPVPISVALYVWVPPVSFMSQRFNVIK